MKENTHRTISLYWTCQLFGWGSAAAYWSYYQIRGIQPLWIEIGSVVWSFVIGIGMTHLYKILSHHYGWPGLTIKKLVPRLFLALCILTFIYVLSGYLSLTLRGFEFNIPTFMGMFSGGLRYIMIWLLTFHLYHYARNSRQAEIDQNKYEKLAIAAQFKQLNTELNPHFLFNSLNSIKALTLENPQAAREAVDLLSDMLRNTLRFSERRVVPLHEELQRIEAYLALEKIRFEERLQYTMEIEEATKLINIPPLSLYNLVENAVKHGINKSKFGGHIHISSFLKNDQIHLVVVNDGALDQSNSNGIGLKNVAERMRLVYGAATNLSLKAIAPNQVESRISLPLL